MNLSRCQRLFALTVFMLSAMSLAQAQYRPIADPVILQTGENLFQQYCASCHGQQAQGIVENWQIVGQDGKYPPPPLDGTAHTWHHSIAGLAHTIKNGTLIIGGKETADKQTIPRKNVIPA